MRDTNYFLGTIKILENPRQVPLQKKFVLISLCGEISQNRKNKLIHLHFWGHLAEQINRCYQLNDYILVEGYLSIRKESTQKNSQKFLLTVLKIYPFLFK